MAPQLDFEFGPDEAQIALKKHEEEVDRKHELHRAYMQVLGPKCVAVLHDVVDIADKTRTLPQYVSKNPHRMALVYAIRGRLDFFRGEWAHLELSDDDLVEKAVACAEEIVEYRKFLRKLSPHDVERDARRKGFRKETAAYARETGHSLPTNFVPPEAREAPKQEEAPPPPPVPEHQSRREKLRSDMDEASIAFNKELDKRGESPDQFDFVKKCVNKPPAKPEKKVRFYPLR
jgi:hypothetical protein